jgi:cysteine desulfuration protein SufE
MTLEQAQNNIIEEFSMFDEWMDKYEYLIEIGKETPPIDEKYKNEKNLIVGCQSRVWLNAELDGDKIKFSADSDAIITKGIIALLIRVMNNRNPAEIMNADLYFIDKIGLISNLSPTRANGLSAMIKQMKLYGMAYNAKINK